MSASRLPGKPLLKINGISIIQHVYNKAKATNLGKVYVATEDVEIQTEIEKNGGNSIMTSKNHQTGTDRIFEAVEKIKDIENIKYVINLQGDEPQISIEDIINLDKNVRKLNSRIGTLCTDIKDKKIFSNKNIVKVSVNETFRKNNYSPALAFFRNAEDFDEKILHQQTGAAQHTSYVPSKIMWMKDNLNNFQEIDKFIDISTYIYSNWFENKNFKASYSISSWSGLLDRNKLELHSELIDYLVIS